MAVLKDLVPLDRKEFKQLPLQQRIEVIVSDGMFLTVEKWAKLAYTTESDILDYIKKALKDGTIIQSVTGAQSYRMPLESMKKWYKENRLKFGDQILTYVFPARVWDGMTEVDGFDLAPRREVGTVTFKANQDSAKLITESLRGLALVKEVDTSEYRAFGLSASFLRNHILELVAQNPEITVKGGIRLRGSAMRRELVDFPPVFTNHLIEFYRIFATSMVKPAKETIDIYLPEYSDKEGQILMWVFDAIEKFDEKASVPFSGYIESILKHRPYDLPIKFLGEDLAFFQNERSRTRKALFKEGVENPSNEVLAERMRLPLRKFLEFDEKYRVWLKARNATTLTWDETNADKLALNSVYSDTKRGGHDDDLASRISKASVEAMVELEDWASGFAMISQIGQDSLDFTRLEGLSSEFVETLGKRLYDN